MKNGETVIASLFVNLPMREPPLAPPRSMEQVRCKETHKTTFLKAARRDLPVAAYVTRSGKCPSCLRREEDGARHGQLRFATSADPAHFASLVTHFPLLLAIRSLGFPLLLFSAFTAFFDHSWSSKKHCRGVKSRRLTLADAEWRSGV